MTQIAASQVKELRDKTGLGMMDCKRALQESNGDIEEAITNLRKSSALKAEKKASRTAVEGVILIDLDKSENNALMIEVNCETDFVAKDENFISFCNSVLSYSKELVEEENSLENLQSQMEESRQALIQKIGENIKIRKLEKLKGETVEIYLHSNKKIGVSISIEGEDKELAKDLAMHIAASSPLVVNPEDLDEEILKKEREIISSQVEGENKPPEIQEKMIEGRINKYLSEVSLVKQPFVKDPNQTIESLLNEKKSKVISFIRLEVGEGIEVEEKDFATEVMSQIEET
tara:strand:- start:632 stop:1498 length:867 start_codon:yes stop_codon:yes gene_type:complete